MPTYEYACKSCESHIEVVQSFTDDALTECGTCGGSLRKVFGTVGISFKGSGFYKTDSRASTPSKSGESGDKKPGESGDKKSGESGDKKPAAETASSDSKSASGETKSTDKASPAPSSKAS